MKNGLSLETERLILKPLCQDDFEEIYKLRSCPLVMKHSGGPKSKREVEQFMQMALPYQEQHGLGFSSVFLKEGRIFIGQAGLFHVGFHDVQAEIELGYRFHKAYWGKGFATESTEALMLWAENNLEIADKVSAFTMPDHHESKRVLEKAGFISLGVQENYYGTVDVFQYELRKNQGLSYDNIADGFAKMRTEFVADKPYVEEFIAHLPPKANVLDVGCGSGVPIAEYLVKHEFSVTGVDGSKELINIAKLNVPTLDGICSDIRTFRPEISFDGIIEWWCLFHLPVQDQLKLLEKFFEWLNPGGTLQFTSGETNFKGRNNDMLNEPLLFFSADKAIYEQKLKELNFKILSCQSDQENHLVWLVTK